MRVLLVAVVAVVAVLALSGLTAQTAEAAPTMQIKAYHTVRPGETVFCIARGYQVNPWSIAYRNHLPNPDFLVPGQTLAIPAGPYWFVPGPTCPPCGAPVPVHPIYPPMPPVHPIHPPMPPPATCSLYHTVQPGQTLYGISLMYGVPMWSIVQANGLANPNYIRVGQQLCIPGGAPIPVPFHGGHGGHGG